MGPGARIGFHAAYNASSGQETGVGNALVGAYLTRIGLPYSAVIYITQAAPDSMTWLNLSEAQQQGIEVTLLETPDTGRVAPLISPTGPSPVLPDLQKRATNFVLGVIEQLSEPSELAVMRFLSRVYPAQVEYYGTVKDRDVVIQDKKKFAERWPVRKYTVRPNTMETGCDLAAQQCDVRGILDWIASSEARNVRSSGSAEFAYKVKLTADGLF
jgi:hypothetical protein